MKADEIDRYCDLYEEQLKTGESLTPEQFLKEQSLSGEEDLLTKLRQLEEAYAKLHEPTVCSPLPETIDAPATSSSPTSSSRKQVGPYKILQELGEGGMGTVYLAEQSKPVRRRVALKLIRSGLDNKQVIARFEAERQALALMDHENIAKVLDAGTTDEGIPYFVMELVRGLPITEYCDKHNLSVDDRLELLMQACRAIQHAHQKGIIHRDIKPTNVLVTEFDDKPVVKVIDFGLAKAMQDTQRLTDRTMFTEFGQVLGTLLYMSPEQTELSVIDVDTRSDVYSLGVLLYELLTGSTPIERQTLKQMALDRVMAAIRDEEPQRPSQRLSSSGNSAAGISQQRQTDVRKLGLILKGDLDWIVMKALEKDRVRRFDSPLQLAEDIQRYLNNEAIHARPPSLSYRVSKTFKRHRPAIIAASLLIMTLVGGIIGTAWQWKRANTAAIESSKQEQLANERAIKNAELAERNQLVSAKALRQEALAKTEAAKAIEQEAIAKTEAQKALAQELIAKSEAEKALVAETMAQQRADELEATLARSNYFRAIDRWDDNRVSDAKAFLEQVPVKHRHFEWHLARNQFEGSDFTCYGHTSYVTSMSFSPDGLRIVSGSYDNTLKVWDAESGEELRTLKGHTADVRCVSFSPDGRRIVSGSGDSTLKVWNAESGEELRTLKGHNSRVTSVSFSPDGRRIVSGSFDKTLKVWDAESGEELLTLKGHNSDVTSVSFSPDGEKLITWDEKGIEIMWSTLTWQKIPNTNSRSNTSSSRPTYTSALSPDGRWKVLKAGEDIRVIDLHYKRLPRVQKFLEYQARPKPNWHLERAERAGQSGYRFAELFHRAWLAKIQPEDAVFKREVNDTYDRFMASNAKGDRLLPKVASEVLGLTPLPTVIEPSSEEDLKLVIELWPQVSRASIDDKPQFSEEQFLRIQEVVSRFANVDSLRTLGVAQYRKGQFKAAIESLLNSVKLEVEEKDFIGVHPSSFAFLAMSYHQLGNKEEAEAYQEKMVAAMNFKAYPSDPIVHRACWEATTLLSGKSVADMNSLERIGIVAGRGSNWGPESQKLILLAPGNEENPNEMLKWYHLEKNESRNIAEKGFDPAWAPAGEHQIAYLKMDTDAFWLCESDGTNPRKLARGAVPSWSADGKFLYYQSEPEMEVRRIDVTNDELKPESIFPCPSHFYPAVSSDGKKIAFNKGDHLVVTDLETKAELFRHPAKDWEGMVVSWSHDNRYVLYSDYGFDTGIWALNTDSGNAQQLIAGPYKQARWFPDGKLLSCNHHPKNEVEVFLVDYLELPN